jgi:hypothetical protein
MSVAELETASDDNWASALTDDEVRSGLTLWAGRIAAGEARFLDLVGELDAREAWGGVGIKSPAHWLAWQCSLTLSTAREHVRAARAVRELPLIRAAFASAALSSSQVRALTRVATAGNELPAGHRAARDRGAAGARHSGDETGERRRRD